MNTAQFRFHGELKAFFHSDGREVVRVPKFESGQSAKHLIESLGIPHTEVHFLHANGVPQDFSYQVKDGDVMDIFPISTRIESGDISLQPSPPGEPRFVLDIHLGRLAAYLRMLGLDTLYQNDYQDEELARISASQNRVLLTRDLRLLMRKQVIYGHWVRQTEPTSQLLEVVGRYQLKPYIQPFQRCLRCNTPLVPTTKEAVLPRLEPLTRQYFDEFRICPACHQIYWKGSHYERMQELVREIMGE